MNRRIGNPLPSKDSSKKAILIMHPKTRAVKRFKSAGECGIFFNVTASAISRRITKTSPHVPYRGYFIRYEDDGRWLTTVEDVFKYGTVKQRALLSQSAKREWLDFDTASSIIDRVTVDNGEPRTIKIKIENHEKLVSLNIEDGYLEITLK